MYLFHALHPPPCLPSSDHPSSDFPRIGTPLYLLPWEWFVVVKMQQIIPRYVSVLIIKSSSYIPIFLNHWIPQSALTLIPLTITESLLLLLNHNEYGPNPNQIEPFLTLNRHPNSDKQALLLNTPFCMILY